MSFRLLDLEVIHENEKKKRNEKKRRKTRRKRKYDKSFPSEQICKERKRGMIEHHEDTIPNNFFFPMLL